MRLLRTYALASYCVLLIFVYYYDVVKHNGFEQFSLSQGQRQLPSQPPGDSPCYRWCLLVGILPLIAVYRTPLWRAYRFLLLTATFLFYVVLLDHYGLWCTYAWSDLSRLCDFAKEINEQLTRRNVTHWVNGGTILPMARKEDEHHRMIPCEHDFDFCIDATQKDLVLHWLRSEAPYHFRELPSNTYLYPPWTEWYKGHSGPPMIDFWWCQVPLVGKISYQEGCYGKALPAPDPLEESARLWFGPNWNKGRCDNHWFLCRFGGPY